MGAYLPDLPRAYNSRSAELTKSRTRKLVEKSGDKGSKKATTASDASGGNSASEKSQPSGGKVREKSQATCTSKTPFEVSTSVGDYKIKTAASLQPVIDKRNTDHTKNAKTVCDRNTAADITEAVED